MKSIQQRSLAAIALAGLFSMAMTAQARTDKSAPMPAAAACGPADVSTWFEQQRQLTDGNTDPAKVRATTECRDTRMDEAKPMRTGKMHTNSVTPATPMDEHGREG